MKCSFGDKCCEILFNRLYAAVNGNFTLSRGYKPDLIRDLIALIIGSTSALYFELLGLGQEPVFCRYSFTYGFGNAPALFPILRFGGEVTDKMLDVFAIVKIGHQNTIV